tara:strand:+ start:568 stop:1587 length:1020 start_codon:yes stop_codon:yes gene_type:complete
MALGTIDTNQIASEAVTVPKVTDQVLSNRNILINGAMRVHQRGNQATTNGGSVYFVDRFNVYLSAASAVANLQQSTDTPSGQGFGNSLLVDVTTADTSVGASEISVLRQILEGLNLQSLKYGTSSAESVTLSFWVKSPKTGVHICELWHLTSPVRTQSQSYTVSAANTWEKHSVTFSGDTTTALDNDNNYTLAVQWGLFAGTDYTSGTLATAWQDSGNTNRYVGQQNFFDSTSNNFYLTGVQLEVGVETPFEHEDYSTTLRKCKRYYELLEGSIYPTNYSTAALGNYFWTEEKRAVPTVTADTNTGGLGFNGVYKSGGYVYKSPANFNSVVNIRGNSEI